MQLKSKPMKFLFFLTSHAELGATGRSTGYFLSEVSHPFYPITELGVEVNFASLLGGKVPMDHSSFDLEDAINRRFVEDTRTYGKLDSTIPIGKIDVSSYAGVFFPGGHGTVFDLPNSNQLATLVASIYESGGIVAAVCHGPSALLNVKLMDGQSLVKGKRVTGFTDDEEREIKLEKIVPFSLETELKKRGAIFEKSDVQKKRVVVDGKLITGQNPASALGVGEEIASMLSSIL